jgi:hypothetical protein
MHKLVFALALAAGFAAPLGAAEPFGIADIALGMSRTELAAKPRPAMPGGEPVEFLCDDDPRRAGSKGLAVLELPEDIVQAGGRRCSWFYFYKGDWVDFGIRLLGEPAELWLLLLAEGDDPDQAVLTQIHLWTEERHFARLKAAFEKEYGPPVGDGGRGGFWDNGVSHLILARDPDSKSTQIFLIDPRNHQRMQARIKAGPEK